MSAGEALLLGIVQGLTEFLPVSSSGHLVLVQSLLPGVDQPGVLPEVFLHLGTSFAVIIYFRRQLAKISLDYLLLLVIGSIPAGIIGLAISPHADRLFSSTFIVGVALLVTAFFNYSTHKAQMGTSKVTAKNSIIVGIAQAVAIIPGISRSGSTIFAGMKLGIEPRMAARFSFLLSIPAILGANMLQLIKYGDQAEGMAPTYLIGFLAALVSGLIAIHLVINLLENRKFIYFTVYTASLGVLLILVNAV